MRSQPRFLRPALALLACAILAGCTGGAASSASRRTTPSASARGAIGPLADGPVGSPGNPLMLSCAQESFPGYPSQMPHLPTPGDLAIGPLFVLNGKLQASAGSGDHGSYPKVPFAVVPGSVVTVTIGAQARREVGIDNPYALASGSGGPVTAATYRPCPGPMGFFAQGFTFTRGRTRGCVPLDVRIGRQPLARHVTISLGAGSCAVTS